MGVTLPSALLILDLCFGVNEASAEAARRCNWSLASAVEFGPVVTAPPMNVDPSICWPSAFMNIFRDNGEPLGGELGLDARIADFGTNPSSTLASLEVSFGAAPVVGMSLETSWKCVSFTSIGPSNGSTGRTWVAVSVGGGEL